MSVLLFYMARETLVGALVGYWMGDARIGATAGFTVSLVFLANGIWEAAKQAKANDYK